MVKSASNLRLFFKKGANSNEIASDVENRAPLSPISIEARNKIAQGNSNNQPQSFPATPQGKKLSSSSLCQKYPNAENVENIAAGPPGTPDQNKSTTTPKSVAKKRFGWNPRPQAQHEEAFSGTSGLRPAAMASGSQQHAKDGALEGNIQFSDTSSSSSSSSDLSIPSCLSSSSSHSGHITTSRMGYDSESSQSTPRSTPSKSIPRPGKPGATSSSVGNLKGPQRTLPANSNSTKCASQYLAEPIFDLQEDPDFWNDHNVQVLVRSRPLSGSEASGQGFSKCLRQESAHTITWVGQPETRFTFDHVAGESITQENLFRVAGLPMVENCMRGYNSSMFAYGQTGSGKTHTMLGDIDDLAYRPSDQRGMTPRIFEYLFARIHAEEQSREHEQLKFVCKCSFLEIYNEHITDLLEPSSTNLQIREDSKTGVYVENLKEVEVTCVQDVVLLLVQGAATRKVASTNMNRESSRSHSVFACSVESKWDSNSLTNIRFGRLNLVDLAGSERQKSSGAEGDRLKEAANINKSLSTLGLVIMILVDVANGKQRHVPYRDSKLTFLLQDSLGGNSKTTVIATVSPSSCNALETLSTLKFAQRAKFIRNNAIINEDASGDVIALRREIQQLKEEVSRLRRQSVSGMQRFESDHEISHPGLSSNNLLQKLRAVEATLTGALRREQASQASAKRYAAEVEQLQSLMQQRDQNTQSGKMILRFRDDKIHRLESFVAGNIPVDHYLSEENNKLAEELDLVRGQIERNPELTRFAMDNIRLMEQVRGYQEFYDNGERETLMEEILNLRDQLLEMREAKLALEQGAIALSSAQADKYRRELEICCNDLSTCLEVNSKLARQVDELQALVGQLNAKCQEQQQDLDLLKAQPIGRMEELELERAVHLQIIADLKGQLQKTEQKEHKPSTRDDDMKNAVQDKYTVQDQTQVSFTESKEIESEFETYSEELMAEKASLFDEDIEQLQVCDKKHTDMEAEFETFSELMAEKESLLDEDLDKIEVCAKRQSLESEFEAHSELMAERKLHLNEELEQQQMSAKRLEMASKFEKYTELMEGEELLLSEGLKHQHLDNTEKEVLSMTSTYTDGLAGKKLLINGNAVHQGMKTLGQPEVESECETFSELLEEKESLLDEDMEHLEICPKRLSLESEFETEQVSTLDEISEPQQVCDERITETGMGAEVVAHLADTEPAVDNDKENDKFATNPENDMLLGGDFELIEACAEEQSEMESEVETAQKADKKLSTGGAFLKTDAEHQQTCGEERIETDSVYDTFTDLMAEEGCLIDNGLAHHWECSKIQTEMLNEQTFEDLLGTEQSFLGSNTELCIA